MYPYEYSRKKKRGEDEEKTFVLLWHNPLRISSTSCYNALLSFEAPRRGRSKNKKKNEKEDEDEDDNDDGDYEEDEDDDYDDDDNNDDNDNDNHDDDDDDDDDDESCEEGKKGRYAAKGERG